MASLGMLLPRRRLSALDEFEDGSGGLPLLPPRGVPQGGQTELRPRLSAPSPGRAMPLGPPPALSARPMPPLTESIAAPPEPADGMPPMMRLPPISSDPGPAPRPLLGHPAYRDTNAEPAKYASGEGASPGAMDIKSAAGVRPLRPPRPPEAQSDFTSPVPASLADREELSYGTESLSPPRDPSYVKMEHLSPAYKQLRAERAGLPTEPEYLEEKRPRGGWARVGEAFKLGGKMLLGSGLNPVYGLAGLAIGALDKDAHNRMSYRTNVEPYSQSRQDRLLNQANRELGMHGAIRDDDRADEQMRLTTDYHNQQQDLGEREYEFKVAKLGREMADAASKAKSAAEKEKYDRAVKAAEAYRLYRTELPPDIAEMVGTPGLAGRVPELAPRPEKPEREPTFEELEAGVGPEAYGARTWTDLVPNPAYVPAREAALRAAGGNEQDLNDLISLNRVQLPPERITAYQMAKDNPYPRKEAALKARNRDRGSRRLNARPRLTASPPAASKKRLTAAQVQSYAESHQATVEEAKTELRRNGYIVP